MSQWSTTAKKGRRVSWWILRKALLDGQRKGRVNICGQSWQAQSLSR
jgi:hypothetical protein